MSISRHGKDMTGVKVGYLTVIEFSDNRLYKKIAPRTLI